MDVNIINLYHFEADCITPVTPQTHTPLIPFYYIAKFKTVKQYDDCITSDTIDCITSDTIDCITSETIDCFTVFANKAKGKTDQ